MRRAWDDHAVVDVLVSVPRGWEVVSDLPDGLPFAARGAPTEHGFRPNVVLTLDEVADDEVADWEQSSDVLMSETMRDHLLIDRGHVERADGTTFLQRTGQHVTDEGWIVTFDQWTFARGGTGYTLTATVTSVDFDEWADVFAEIGHRFADPTDAPTDGREST